MSEPRYGFGHPLLVSPYRGFEPFTCDDAELLRMLSTPPSPRTLRRRSRSLENYPPPPRPFSLARNRRTYFSASALAQPAEDVCAEAVPARGADRSWADEHLLSAWDDLASGRAALLGRGTFGWVFRYDLPNQTCSDQTPTPCAVKLYIASGVTIDDALHEFEALCNIGCAERGSRAARARALDPTSDIALSRLADARRPADQRARCAADRSERACPTDRSPPPSLWTDWRAGRTGTCARSWRAA